MKVYSVRVSKKNGQFVANNYVLENAIDAYKAMKQSHSKSQLVFAITDERMVAEQNGKGEIFAYTVDGFRSNVRVNG